MHAPVDETLSERLAGCDASFMMHQRVRVQRVNGQLYKHWTYTHTDGQ